MANRSQRRQSRWGKHPSKLSKARVRQILVEDAIAGRATPLIWAGDAFLYLGGGTGAGAEREYLSVRQEVGSLGGSMPGAPGS